MLEHRFTVEGYLAFLSEFDEETLFEELEPGRCASACWPSCASASAGCRRDEMTLRFPIVFATGRRSGALSPSAGRGDQPSPDSPAGSALGRRVAALGSLALGGLALGGLGDDRLLLDARRLDLGDDLVAVGQQRDVGRDDQVADVDRRVEVDERLDRVLDRLRQVVGQRPDPDGLASGGGACRRAA